MKKSLIPLLAAGIVGCSSYNNTLVIVNPIEPRANEVQLADHGFQDATERSCYRFVYGSLVKEEWQSVLKIEHCFKEGSGDFSWKLYEDTNNDGTLDKICASNKVSYAGLKQDEEKVDCKNYQTETKMGSVLTQAVWWTQNTSLQQP